MGVTGFDINANERSLFCLTTTSTTKTPLPLTLCEGNPPVTGGLPVLCSTTVSPSDVVWGQSYRSFRTRDGHHSSFYSFSTMMHTCILIVLSASLCLVIYICFIHFFCDLVTHTHTHGSYNATLNIIAICMFFFFFFFFFWGGGYDKLTENVYPCSPGLLHWHMNHGPLARYAKLRVRMRRECRERFPRHRR